MSSAYALIVVHDRNHPEDEYQYKEYKPYGDETIQWQYNKYVDGEHRGTHHHGISHSFDVLKGVGLLHITILPTLSSVKEEYYGWNLEYASLDGHEGLFVKATNTGPYTYYVLVADPHSTLLENNHQIKEGEPKKRRLIRS